MQAGNPDRRSSPTPGRQTRRPERKKAGLENGNPPAGERSEISRIMFELGAKGWDALPTYQLKWQGLEGEAPLYRIWSWLCAHTVHWHQSAFAVDRDGNEIYLERLAKDLAIDEANVRMYWSEGVRRGLWRNGTKQEGRRRMYLCGEAPAEIKPSGEEEAKGEDPENEKVCTYRRKRMRPYILNQIAQLPPDAQHAFWEEWTPRHLGLDQSFADLAACHRSIESDHDDNQFARFGVKKIREEREIRGTPEEIAAKRLEAENKAKRIKELRPAIERYVHTVQEFVRETKKDVCIPQKTARTNSPSLSDLSRAPGGSDVASERSSVSRRSKASQQGQERMANELPTGEQAISVCSKCEEAAQLFFSELPRMQEAYKHTDFGLNAFSRERTTDQILVGRLILITGCDRPPDCSRGLRFLLEVAAKFKGLDRNAMGKLPPRAPGDQAGPRAFGLLLEWAKDFACRNPVEVGDRG